MTHNQAIRMIRALGAAFADGLEAIDKEVPEGTSNLWNGLAAYTILKMEGQNDDLDRAYNRIVRDVTDAAFAMARQEVAQ